MYTVKDKDYFPYALSNYFCNNRRWQTRVFNNPQYRKPNQRVEQYKEELLKLVPDEKQAKAKAILNEIYDIFTSLEGISIDEVAIEGLRAGLELGELFYSGKSLEVLLNENALVEVKEKKLDMTG